MLGIVLRKAGQTLFGILGQSIFPDGESNDAEMTDAAPGAAAAAAVDIGLSEEETLFQQALAMSMNENEPTT